ESRCLSGQGDVRRDTVRIAGDAPEDFRSSKNSVDRAQHILAGPERELEFAMAKRELRAAMPGRKQPRHIGELFRSSPREGEDRLLLVADREYAARLRLACPLPGHEFRSEPADDLPLPRARILGLVDQYMIDAEVELVVHPGGLHIGEQREALPD